MTPRTTSPRSTTTGRLSTTGRISVCREGGNSLGQSPAALAEVQICGIPKLSIQEVAPTP